MSVPNPATARPHPSTTAAVVVAWLVVGVPALWGVYQTAMKSKALFHPPAAVATTTAPAPGR